MKILVVFGSLLGKTKRIAVLIGHQLKQQGFEVKVKDVRDTNINEIEYFDIVVLGSSTWDDGMLQFDFRPFHAALMKHDNTGKTFAVFGVGGHKYPHYCLAADILEKTVTISKGKLIVPTLRLDIDHDEPADKLDGDVLEWTSQIAAVAKLQAKQV
jgi:flavodoxin